MTWWVFFPELDLKLVVYIWVFRQFNNKQYYYTLSIRVGSQKVGWALNFLQYWVCRVTRKYASLWGKYDLFEWWSYRIRKPRLEYLQVDTPLDFKIIKRSIEAAARLISKCRNLLIESAEITLRQNLDNESLCLNAKRAKISQQYDQFLQVGGVSLRITIALRIR